MGELDGQVAIITGAARGQGRSHAVTLARAGANIVACDIAGPVSTAPYAMATIDDLHYTAELVGKAGGRCLTVQADVRRLEQMQGVVGNALAEFGKVDVLVANAGIMTLAGLDEMTSEIWQETIDINLTGVANSIRAVLPPMLQQQYGRIVATASGAGRMGERHLAHYCASKWGVIGLVKSTAMEFAKRGITCNAVSPSAVNTNLIHNDACYAVFRPDLEAPTIDDVKEVFLSLNEMPVPWVEPEDVSEAVLFLVSPRARYITGVAFDVAAGQNTRNSA
ncbi:MAG TPA: mycofactocin-coupled SDR family oxidoreductase [Acidobacteriaceae bacterium]|nr:mycofactocin-coupled SDR family oxidoreductase [Acidobacteriaceae bacterium]